MTTLRLYSRRPDGRLEDLQHEIGLSECAGVCPEVGDHILASVSGDLGTFGEVKARYFKAKGLNDYVAVVVEERDARPDEIDLF